MRADRFSRLQCSVLKNYYYYYDFIIIRYDYNQIASRARARERTVETVAAAFACYMLYGTQHMCVRVCVWL